MYIKLRKQNIMLEANLEMASQIQRWMNTIYDLNYLNRQNDSNSKFETIIMRNLDYPTVTRPIVCRLIETPNKV